MGHRLVRFTSVDLFVGLAVRTHAALHLLDEPESQASLLATGPSAHRTFHAALGPGAVAVRNLCFSHEQLPQAEMGGPPENRGRVTDKNPARCSNSRSAEFHVPPLSPARLQPHRANHDLMAVMNIRLPHDAVSI